MNNFPWIVLPQTIYSYNKLFLIFELLHFAVGEIWLCDPIHLNLYDFSTFYWNYFE